MDFVVVVIRVSLRFSLLNFFQDMIEAIPSIARVLSELKSSGLFHVSSRFFQQRFLNRLFQVAIGLGNDEVARSQNC